MPLFADKQSSVRDARWFWGSTAFTALILMQYSPFQQPVIGDRAYFLYMAQSLLRGEPVYQTTSLGYPPYGIFVTAAALFMETVLDINFLTLVRLSSILLSALIGGLLFRVARPFTHDNMSAFMAVVLLLLIDIFLIFSVSNFEPKLFVLLLAILGIIWSQKERWFWVGITGSVAALSWQPAILLLVPPFFILGYRMIFQERTVGKMMSFGGGILCGALPLVFYLTSTAQWLDFIDQAIWFKLLPRPYLEDQSFMRLIGSFVVAFRSLALIPLGLACVGLARAFQKMGKETGWRPLKISSPTVLLLWHTLIWALYHVMTSVSSIEYHGSVDYLPMLYVILIWAAIGFDLLFAPKYSRDREPARWGRMLGAMLLVMLVLGHSMRYEVDFSLADERALFEAAAVPLVADVADTPVLAINLPEVYVLSNIRSPWDSLYVNDYFVDYLSWRHGLSCQDLLNDLESQRYNVVYLQIDPRGGPCLDVINDQLSKSYKLASLANFQIGETVSCGLGSINSRILLDGIRAVDLTTWQTVVSCILRNKLFEKITHTGTGDIYVYVLTSAPHAKS